ncbi:MAG: hypothetical protein JWM81_1069 [Candidatus Saccharibacteria bacterium]|nr:hypothetical protein [Candidatus Saccharibacteria bacterium]
MIKSKDSLTQPTDQRGFAHHIIFVVVIVIVLVGLVGLQVAKKAHKDSEPAHSVSVNTGPDMGDPDSLDPVTKGKASTNGKCTGKGSTKMTYAPMKAADIGTIAPMGEYGGAHVTPIDHEYYYGVDPTKPKDAYPVYAVMDGTLTSMGSVSTPTSGTNWNITLAHSCTFMVLYNLMTSMSPDIMKQVPSNWREMGGAVKVPVKAGQLIGYVGGQSLDFQVGDTTFTNPKLLYHTAYNNTEPFKINTVHPLDYFADSVKKQILPKYLRTVEPRDGNYAYDIDGTATGNWFKVGTNGYAGGDKPTSNQYSTTTGHLALAYEGFDPSALVVSTGDYQNGVGKELLVNDKSIDWAKITPTSGPVKVQLAEGSLKQPDGSNWSGGYVAGGLKYVPNFNLATALVQLTAKQELKFEIFIGKSPSQVSGFDANAVTYNRGQDAHMVKSTTASPSVNKN